MDNHTADQADRAEYADRVYTDEATEIMSGHLAALLAGWDRDDDIAKRLGEGSNGLEFLRKFYDRHEQDQPITFDGAPVVRRSWVAAYLPEGRPTQQEQADHVAAHVYDDPTAVAAQWKRQTWERNERRRRVRAGNKVAVDAVRAGGLDPNTKYTPGEIERAGTDWAARAVGWWRDDHAAQRAQGRRYDVCLTMTAAQLVQCGATVDELAALRPADTAALAEAGRRLDIERQADAIETRTAAQKLIVQRAGGVVAPPEFVSLTDLLSEPDDAAAYRIGELWPIGGRVLLAAAYKSGKSTTVGNAARALVDGGAFLGRFPVEPVGKVVLIDTELDTRTLRRWLRDQGIRSTDAIAVLSLRGKVSAFDILDRAGRTEWARRCAGADVVILDCLRPVLDALDLSEDKDAGRFLVAFDDMLAEAGVGEALVVTHMGHQNERARGDSRLLDWPDALWKIVRDPKAQDTDEDAARYFSALGRDVSLSEGALSFDPDTRRLAYEGGSRKDAAGSAMLPGLFAVLRTQPGLSGRAIETELMNQGASQADVRAAIRRARADGLIRVEPGPKNSHRHYVEESGGPFDLRE
ncbi:AAA family ATPase [Nocardia sp. XZ_19_231]|uniref:AAA family ATPase n=1 Tax=Nocardia sp. XZ_19_231 TaxID=2769252 RepID=UPI00188FA659